MINDYLFLTVSSYYVRGYGLGIGGQGLGASYINDYWPFSEAG
jgi:hypothetical protein